MLNWLVHFAYVFDKFTFLRFCVKQDAYNNKFYAGQTMLTPRNHRYSYFIYFFLFCSLLVLNSECPAAIFVRNVESKHSETSVLMGRESSGTGITATLVKYRGGQLYQVVHKLMPKETMLDDWQTGIICLSKKGFHSAQELYRYPTSE